ncbi:MAG: NAD(+) synthase [Acutalibacteraceae bacterium]
MKDGFIKAAAATPKIRVADCEFNKNAVIDCVKQAAAGGVGLLCLPELCITGYTCGDLFLQDTLIDSAERALLDIAAQTADLDIIFAVGLPLRVDSKLYNCAAVISRGEILGLVPKTFIPNYGEFYEQRHFSPAPAEAFGVSLSGGDYAVDFGTDLIFRCCDMPGFTFAVEICEDLWSPAPPSVKYAANGAHIILNLSASNEVIGKAEYRTDLVKGQSARLVCGYVYCSAGDGESTSDMVFSGHNIIAENGSVLRQSKLFCNEMTVSEIDVARLARERQRMNTFPAAHDMTEIYFDLPITDTSLTRFVDPHPFVPSDENKRSERCEMILTMQAEGLRRRVEHIHCKTAVIGISGGLDSCLALLVTVRAFDLLNKDRSGIIAVTMPCFGTTARTRSNAEILCRELGVSFREIDIKRAVDLHFADIGQNADQYDVTYENAQARERTQVLMDIANMSGGIVIGTGDLSELALGWATYNGDHMSMYAVNASVPKTLVRHLVRHYADTCGIEKLKSAIYDIYNTPVSPELLPAENGDISQKTEDLVGPYELHDFFLYYMLRFGMHPKKIFRLALTALGGQYSREEILKWLKVFMRRFFAQQFKRSCLPDGPKIGTVAVSPRADLRMPSDACADLWLKELDDIR